MVFWSAYKTILRFFCFVLVTGCLSSGLADEFRLIGPDGKSYISQTKGKFGGHKKLKIYGRLDCPSALRWIAKGHYVNQRVFFATEEDAISAGYRPCAVCMKAEYKKWKNPD